MSKTSIVIIIYIIGLIFGALVLNIWSADTSVLKGLLGLRMDCSSFNRNIFC